VSSRIRVAIIGCGGITSAHLRGIKILQDAGIDDVEVTVLCSRKEESARRYNDRHDAAPPLPPIAPFRDDPVNIRDVYLTDLKPGKPAKVCTNWREAVLDPNVDAVIVLATVEVHHSIGLGAMAAGKHVCIEKPFAITVRAARRLCEMADQKGLSLGVAESLRYKPETRATRWALDSGYIGHLEMVAQMGIGGGWAPDKIVGKTGWRHVKRRTGGGILMDVGAHVFDKVRYLCGEPKRIAGVVRTIEPLRTTRSETGEIIDRVTCDVEDTAFATIIFENDAIGTFSMSWAGHGEETSVPGGMVLYGDLGCIQNGHIISDHQGTLPLQDSFEHQAGSGLKKRWFPGGVTDAFALELHEFFEAIRRKRQPETSGLEGLRDVAVGYGIIESSYRGEAVEFSAIESCEIENYQRPINDFHGLRT